MDLFIIIAAVMAVGGVVTASVYGLAGSASSNASVQVVQASAAGGAPSSSSSINSFSITVKNTGSTTITGTLTIALGGSKQPAALVTTPVPTTSVSGAATAGGAWTLGGTSGNPVLLVSSSTLSLPPGTQVAVSEGTLALVTAGNGWNIGTTYPITVTFNGAQTTINVVA